MPDDVRNEDRGPWGNSGKSEPQLDDLLRQGQDRLKEILPSASPRGVIAIVALSNSINNN